MSTKISERARRRGEQEALSVELGGRAHALLALEETYSAETSVRLVPGRVATLGDRGVEGFQWETDPANVDDRADDLSCDTCGSGIGLVLAEFEYPRGDLVETLVFREFMYRDAVEFPTAPTVRICEDCSIVRFGLDAVCDSWAGRS